MFPACFSAIFVFMQGYRIMLFTPVLFACDNFCNHSAHIAQYFCICAEIVDITFTFFMVLVLLLMPLLLILVVVLHN